MAKPKKPTRLKILDGDQPCRINRSEPKSPAGLGPCPDWLDDHGQEAWARLKAVLDDMGVSTRADDEAATMYCRAYSSWRKAYKTLDAEGQTVTTDTTTKAHPCVAIVNQAEKTMVRLLGRFGMTPADRAGLHVQENPEGSPVLDHFRPKGAPGAKGRK